MKSKTRKWERSTTSPWMTRSEAGDYLRWSVWTVDRNLVPMQKERVTGKLRYVLQGTHIHKVRILAEDVYALCPLPKDKPPPLQIYEQFTR